MEIYDTKGIVSFLDFVSSKKKEWTNWEFTHADLSMLNNDRIIIEIETAMQCYEGELNGALLEVVSSNQAVLFTHRTSSLPVKKIIAKETEGSAVELISQTMWQSNVAKLAELLDSFISDQDTAAQIGLKRLRRQNNNIMIVDDDLMVLKTLEKLLAGYGEVVTLQDPGNFPEAYIENAPNIVFLDIHLGQAKGNEILKTLKTTIDPHAYVVIISSDTREAMIEDIKEGSADGFIMKPFQKERVYSNLLSAPSIIPQ